MEAYLLAKKEFGPTDAFELELVNTPFPEVVVNYFAILKKLLELKP
jgi:hypothetical protein